MTDRPAHEEDEIEVTPEMIEAALSVFTYEALPLYTSADVECVKVYREMERVRRKMTAPAC